MQMVPTDNVIFIGSAVLIIVALVLASSYESDKLADLVPREVNGWQVQVKDQTYAGKGIFEYIDGAGEVYLAYDFRKLFVRRFSKTGEPDIVVELFDMDSSNDAYGVFSHDREVETEEVGQACEQRGGLLSFWKDRFLVSVFAEGQTKASRDAVLSLAKSIASRIKTTSSKPQMLSYLPVQGLVKNSIRYFHKHSILNYHHFLAEDNILYLSEKTECVLAKYELDKGGCLLLLVRYHKVADSDAAYGSFISAYLPEAQNTGIAKTENGKWTAMKKEGLFLIVVFDSPDETNALYLLDTVTKKLEVRKP